MSTSGFATVNPSTDAEIETFSFFNPAQQKKSSHRQTRVSNAFANYRFTDEPSSFRAWRAP